MQQETVYARNKKATHDYFIEKTWEAGIALKGTEVKSIRAGKVNLKESYCGFRKGELFLYGMHVSPYKEGNRFNEDPLRTRKLLMHKQELRRLAKEVEQQSMTVVALKIYASGKNIKVEIALAKGKKLYDKRESLKEKHIERDLRRSGYRA